MKDIKFRYVFKHKETNEIILKYWTLADIEENGLPVYYNENEYELLSRDLCIKIEDIEFYENDKVEVEEHYRGDYHYKDYIGIITYDIGELYIQAIDRTDYMNLFDWFYNHENKKIIGNIYE